MPILHYIHQSDLQFFHRVHCFPGRTQIQKYAGYISRSADGHMYVMIGLALLIYGETFYAKVLAMSFVIERVLYIAGKNVFRRSRPSQTIDNFESAITPSDYFSLPSGHTSGAFLMTLFLAYIIPISLVITIPWALCVGASRVILGVHFPSDIIAGAVLGISACAFSILSMTQ